MFWSHGPCRDLGKEPIEWLHFHTVPVPSDFHVCFLTPLSCQTELFPFSAFVSLFRDLKEAETYKQGSDSILETPLSCFTWPTLKLSIKQFILIFLSIYLKKYRTMYF